MKEMSKKKYSKEINGFRERNLSAINNLSGNYKYLKKKNYVMKYYILNKYYFIKKNVTLILFNITDHIKSKNKFGIIIIFTFNMIN